MHPDALCVRTQVYPRVKKIVTLFEKVFFEKEVVTEARKNGNDYGHSGTGVWRMGMTIDTEARRMDMTIATESTETQSCNRYFLCASVPSVAKPSSLLSLLLENRVGFLWDHQNDLCARIGSAGICFGDD